MHETKQKLLNAGLGLLLERGYNDLGIQSLLAMTNVPKGSFYHHFRSKEDFALQAVQAYMDGVHVALDACLNADDVAPLTRIRNFFEAVATSYHEQGYLGCMLGALGQELSGVSETFRIEIDGCLLAIGERLERCLALAVERGELRDDADTQTLAYQLVNCWEGAALRSRLTRSPDPLVEMLDFYFVSALGVDPSAVRAGRSAT